MKNSVFAFLTVDTENMNSPLQKGSYSENLLSIESIRPIIDLCLEFNIKAVFFLSVFEHCKFNKESIRDIAQFLDSQGHDVQLHTHPYWCYGREHMWQYSLNEQIKIIKEGRNLLFEWLGRHPIAHRAGAYGINRDTIKALQVNNIHIDSSMYFGHPNCKLSWSKNRLIEKNKIVQIPVTGFFRKKYITLGNYKIKYRKKFVKTDIDWCSIDELVHFGRDAQDNNIKIMNLFMHSYSLLAYNSNFSNFSLNEKKKQTLKRFLKICTRNLNIRFITFQQFWDRYRINPQQFHGSDCVPVIPFYNNIFRLFNSRFNYFAK